MKSELIGSSRAAGLAGSGFLIRLLLVLSVLVASAVFIAADAQESDALDSDFSVGDIGYIILGSDTVYACSIDNEATHVIVPATVTSPGGHEYKVQYVDFYTCKNLVSAVLSPGIEGIGPLDDAGGFSRCGRLADVDIPDTVRWISKDAFEYCHSLKSLYIPDSVSRIAGKAFYGSGLTSVKLPENPEYTTMEEELFCECKALQSVVIPSNVTAIGSSCFHGCDAITQLVIPENVKTIADYALSNMDGLTFVDLRCDSNTGFGYMCLAPAPWNDTINFVKIKTSISKDTLLDKEAILEEEKVGPDLEFGYELSGSGSSDGNDYAWSLVDGHLKVWGTSEDVVLEGGDCFRVIVGGPGSESHYNVRTLIRDVEFVSDIPDGKYPIVGIGDDVFYHNWQDTIVLPDDLKLVYGDGINAVRIVKASPETESLLTGEAGVVIVPDKYMESFKTDDVKSVIIEVDGPLSSGGPVSGFLDGKEIDGVVFFAGDPSSPVIYGLDATNVSDGQLFSDVDGKVWHSASMDGKRTWAQVPGLRTVVFDFGPDYGIQLRKVVSDGSSVGCSDLVYSTLGNFAGWFDDDGRFVSPDAMVENVCGSDYLTTLHAGWDGAFVVLGTGVTAMVDGIVYARYATVPLGSSMTVSFDSGDLYCAAGFDVSGSVYTPIAGMQTYSVTAKTVGSTNVTFDLDGGQSECGSMSVPMASELPKSYVEPYKTGFYFVGYVTPQGDLLIAQTGSAASPCFVASVEGFTDESGHWINENSAVTLKAVWNPHVTTVTLHNMGVVGDMLISATYDQFFPDLDLEQMGIGSDDYRFDGYYDALGKDGVPAGNMIIDNGGRSVYIYKEVNPYFDGYTWKGDIETYDLYALWTPKYTLIIDGGQSIELSKKEVYEVLTPENAGYTFSGWRLGGDADYSAAVYGSTDDSVDNRISEGQLFSGGDDTFVSSLCSVLGGTVTMTSMWAPISYTVNFDFNGGRGGTTHVNAIYGAVISVSAPEKENVFFEGWILGDQGEITSYAEQSDSEYGPFSDMEAGEKYGAGLDTLFVKNLACTQNAEVTLTAQWTTGQYYIRFDPGADGVGGSMPDMVAYFGTGCGLATHEYFRTGYSFVGWSTEKGGSVDYEDSQTVMDLAEAQNEIVILYAVWSVDQHRFSFKNTGATKIEDIVLDYGAPVPKPDNPEWPGHVFNGWIYNNRFVDIPSTMTYDDRVFYADWKTATYTVSFDANGGSGTMDDETIDYGASTTLYPNEFKKTGHEFAGWNTEEDGSGTPYADKDVVTDLGDVTLFAQWAPVSYTVVFHSNFEPEETVSQSYKYDVAKRLTANSFVNEGYDFGSWNTEKDGSGTSYADKQRVKNLTKYDGATVDLYAQWLTSMTTIVLDKGEHGISDGAATVRFGDERADISQQVQCEDGCVIDYYGAVPVTAMSLRAAPTAVPVLYPDGSLAPNSPYTSAGKWSWDGKNGDVVLTAVFIEKHTCSVIDASSNEVVRTVEFQGAASERTFDVSVEDKRAATIKSVLAEVEPGKSAEMTYSFDQDAQTVTVMSEDGSWSDVEIRVNYVPVICQVILKAGPGGKVGFSVDDVSYGTVYKTFDYGVDATVVAVPDEGYDFVGWSDGVEDAQHSFPVEGDVELTATFALKQFTVTLIAGIGGLVNGSLELIEKRSYGDEVQAVAEPDEGYVFNLWSDYSTEPSRTIVVEGDVELTAYFKKILDVTWKNWDGSVLYEDKVKSGDVPVYGGEKPYYKGHDFVGWDPEVKEIYEDTVYTAVFDVEMVTYTWFDEDGSVLYTETIPYGEKPVYGGPEPVKDGYVFVGWDETEPGMFVPMFVKEDPGVPVRNVGFGMTLGYDKPAGDVDHTGYWNLSFDFTGSIPDGKYWPYGNDAVMAVKFFFSDGGNLADAYAYNRGAGSLYSSEYVVVPVFEFNGMPYVEDRLCTPDLWPVGPDGTMYAYPVQAEAVLYTPLYNEDDDFDKK